MGKRWKALPFGIPGGMGSGPASLPLRESGLEPPSRGPQAALVKKADLPTSDIAYVYIHLTYTHFRVILAKNDKGRPKSMEEVNALAVRNNLGAILDRLNDSGEPILVLKGRKLRAVLVTPEDFESRFLDYKVKDREILLF